MKVITTPTSLEGVLLVEIVPFRDERGFFIEPWSKRDFDDAGLAMVFLQEGHSKSKKGILRGLHYQDMSAPMAKLVRCTVGEIFDVVVDLRASSKTFGQWLGITLSAENMKQIYIPVGFAHGFVALSETAELQYKQTNYYTPASEGGIIWNDPDVGIQWPITDPVISERDRKLSSFKEYKNHPAFS